MAEKRRQSLIQNKKTKKKVLYKKNRNVQISLLAAACIFVFAFVMSILGSGSLFASASASAVSVHRLFALLFILLSMSNIFGLIPRLSALLLSALLSASGVFTLILEPLTILSMLSVFGVSMSLPRSLAFLSMSNVLMPRSEPVLFFPLFAIQSFLQILTLVLERQKLGQQSGIIKRASSKETSTTFIPLFPPSKYPSAFFFLFSNIGKKRLFNKVFNIDYWLLADYYTKKDVDLNFANYQCSSTVKANRP